MINSKDSVKFEEKLNEDVQFIYGKLLAEGEIDEAIELKEKSGVEPDYSRKDVQKVYVDLIKNGSLSSIKGWKMCTGVEPVIDEKLQETVQKNYILWLKNGDYDYVKDFKKVTGIEVNSSDKRVREIVNRDYVYAFEKDWSHECKKFIKTTGICPSKEILEKLIEKYGVNWDD